MALTDPPKKDAKSPAAANPGVSVERSAPSRRDAPQPSSQEVQVNDSDELVVKMIKISSSTADRLKQLDGLLKMVGDGPVNRDC